MTTHKFSKAVARVLCISLCMLSYPSFSALLDTQPSLPSADDALEQADSINQAALSDLNIAYNQIVFLEYNPLQNQKETQFAAINQSDEKVLQQYAANQQAAKEQNPQKTLEIRDYQKSVNTSTLSPDLIAISRGYDDDSDQQARRNAQAQEPIIENSNLDDSEIYNQSSQRHQDTWSRISGGQEMHADRYNRTQRAKKGALSIADMGGNKNVRARNNLFFKNPTARANAAKRSSNNSNYTRSNYVEKYPQPNNIRIDSYQQELWVSKMSSALTKRMPDTSQREEALRNIYTQALSYDLKPDLVLALIQIESNFKPKAVSSVGARGLMQVMPFWKNELGSDADNLHDVETNIRYGCTILRHYLNIENEKLIPALARYNGSYGKDKYPNKVIHAWLNHWQHL